MSGCFWEVGHGIHEPPRYVFFGKSSFAVEKVVCSICLSKKMACQVWQNVQTRHDILETKRMGKNGPRWSIEEKEHHAMDLHVVVVVIAGPHAWCTVDASNMGTSNRSAYADIAALSTFS